jgi:hypothetical protein
MMLLGSEYQGDISRANRFQIQIADFRLQTADCRFRFRLQIQIANLDSDCKVRFRFQLQIQIQIIADFRFQIQEGIIDEISFGWSSHVLNLNFEN